MSITDQVQVFMHDPHDHDHRYQQSLQTILDQVALQSCENERFCQTIRVLELQYHRRMYAVRQLIQRMDQTLVVLDEQRLKLTEEHDQVEEHLKQLEIDLPMTQRHAVERQRKRANRRRKYDRYYWIPLVARRCKLKYMQARDKHVVAEHQCAQLREALEACQGASGRIRSALGGLQQEHSHVDGRRRGIAQELMMLQNTLNGLLDRRQFWCDFEANQVRMVVESAQHYLSQPEILATMENWFKTFQTACFEYGECLGVGKERWGPVAVEFDCIACNCLRCEWPLLTTGGLVCKQCCTSSSSSLQLQLQQKKLLECNDKRLPRHEATPGRISLKHKLVSTVLSKLAKSRLINGSLSKHYL